MKYHLNDNAVKRIAAIAHHTTGDVHGNLHNIYNNLTHPDTISKITNAHTTNAMQHKFTDKDDENRFKTAIAKAAAINRGTLEVIPTPSQEPKG